MVFHPATFKDLSTWSQGERPARTSPLADLAEAWLENEVNSFSNIDDWCRSCAQTGSYGKMSLASYRLTEDGTLPKSFKGWQNSGMALLGVSLTLSTGEFPSVGGESFLSDIVEQDVPPKYYLTKKAIQGVLNRNQRRANLDEWLARLLQAALESSE